MIKGYEELELSTQMIIQEALERNIKVEVIDWDDNFIRLTKNNRVEYLKQATKTSIDSYIAPLIMENKEVTKKILKERGLRVPEGHTIKSIEDGIIVFESLMETDLVIKPKSTNFGKGVAILKRPYSLADVIKAMEIAFTYDTSILFEEYIDGKEYRFMIVGDEVVAILHRVPANVVGDGIKTIRQLVDDKNHSPLRGKGYVTPLEKIILGDVEQDYLKNQDKTFDTIPLGGETVYLRENSNISTGGDSIDYTDNMSDEFKQIAVKAANSVGAKICGADIMIQDIHAKPNKDNYGIIELNFNPAIHIHDYPYKGKNRQVEKKILDLLGFC